MNYLKHLQELGSREAKAFVSATGEVVRKLGENKEMAITAAFIFAFAVFPHGTLAYDAKNFSTTRTVTKQVWDRGVLWDRVVHITTGGFLYNFYKFALDQVLHGPVGELGALGLCLGGFWTGVTSRLGGWASGIPMMILGGGLYNLDALSKALGWIC